MPDTNESAIKQMENEIASSVRETTHQAQVLRPSAPNLDAARLVELARDRLVYARNRLTEVKREHQMKLFEVDTHYQQRLEDARRERDDAIARLESQTTAQAKPAQDMIALVERLLG